MPLGGNWTGICVFVFLAQGLGVWSSRAEAQSTDLTWSAGIAVGVSRYDASGTGASPLVSLRVARRVVGWLVAEGSAAYVNFEEQLTDRSTSVAIFEAQGRLEPRCARVTPYAGVGIGVLHLLNDSRGRDANSISVSGAGGLRIGLSTRFSISGEVRVRAWDSFSASANEWTVGANIHL